MLEKEIESQILQWMNVQPGMFAIKINTTGIYDPVKRCYRTIKNPYIHKGCSDILFWYNDRSHSVAGAIEVKTPIRHKISICNPNQHDIEQIDFLEKVHKAGGHSIRVSTLDQVINFFKSIRANR